jgi:ABC-type Zn uptake system ZnuABC Zn-binding protein ZnuA
MVHLLIISCWSSTNHNSQQSFFNSTLQEAKKLIKQKEEDDGDDEEGAEKQTTEDGEEDEVFYGAPDDHAWTDASHAIKEAANSKDEGPDMSVSFMQIYLFYTDLDHL